MNRILSLAFAGALALAAVPGAASAQAPAPAAAPAAEPSAPQEMSGRTERRRDRRRADVVTREELVQSGTTNLFAAVERLRPQWMRPRGFTNFRGGGTAIVVYQGTTPLGGLDALRQLAPEFAEEMRFLDSSEASNTLPGLGSRAVAGAIVIVRPGVARP
jgi:hypothetical protein